MPNRFFKLIEAIVRREKNDKDTIYVRKLMAEYRSKMHLYEEFRQAVHKLVDAFLEERGYKYQIVSRTKTPERLREKLFRKLGEGHRYPHLSEIEDLAGVRVLFYSDADKERFARQLKKEIDGTLYIRERKKDTGYEATHVIMTLGDKRLSLAEYKHFRDMRAEIQLTSILQHAWAEIEHDFIYKDISGLRQRDPQKFAHMEKKMAEILEKYIKKASQEFEDLMRGAEE